MFFASDNWAGAHPNVAAALTRHAAGFASAYGTSDLDARVEQTFNEVFGREVAVFFVATGTAANALALASAERPGGVCFCHTESHMIEDECGAPEFLSSGMRLKPVPGGGGRMDAETLKREIARFTPGNVHSGQPAAVSITQTTEIGTVYSLEQIVEISAVARERGLPLHMDGARFANALAALGCTPAEMTWQRGVDIVSFGATKNGCWCAEAIVFLDPSRAVQFPFMRKRAAQLFSKTRFVAAQFEAYFAGGLWMQAAIHANAMGARLAEIMRGSNTLRLAWEPAANEVFAVMRRDKAASLRAAGAVFYDWNEPHHWDGGLGEDETLCRFVTSFATTAGDVERFAGLLRRG